MLTVFDAILMFLVLGASLTGLTAATATERNAQPNIVFILTDDQDLHLGSLDLMSVVQDQLINQGTIFNKHYAHVSQCCPSRATLWTGRHAHNTNITNVMNNQPGGAWAHVQKFGWYKNYLANWMQQAGYNTYYAGKIYNGINTINYCKPACLTGWTGADILIDPGTYTYYNSVWTHSDGKNVWSKPNRTVGLYSTDQIADMVSGYIDQSVAEEKPFFAVAAPVAPHMSIDVSYPNNQTKFPYPVAKKEYADLFQDLVMPKSPNYNPANRTGVAGVWALEPLGESNVGYLDEYYRVRQRCLKSVDDLVNTIVQKLESAGVMDNTYIIYSSDNGYHIGNHRLQGGKTQCFEEDINVPFIVRGPNVAQGQSTDLVTGHIDIAPTILGIAGVDPDPSWDLDGQAITFPLESSGDFQRNFDARGELTHVEFWGPLQQEGMFGQLGVNYNTSLNIYKALRLQGADYNIMYSVWCQGGAHELYDMTWDQYQMTNLHPDAPTENSTYSNAYKTGMNKLLGRDISDVIQRLDALVLVEKSCVGESCRNPWAQLHPTENVSTLTDALDSKYDKFYSNAYANAQVGWKQCYTGYVGNMTSTLYDLDNEQPLWTNDTVVKIVRSGADQRSAHSVWALIAGCLCVLFLV